MTVWDCGQVARGAVVLVHVKLTVTGELFQLFPFGCGEIAAAIAGGVFAIFRLIFPVFELPAASVTVPETVCAGPSVVIA